jgi:hypothetical protein
MQDGAEHDVLANGDGVALAVNRQADIQSLLIQDLGGRGLTLMMEAVCQVVIAVNHIGVLLALCCPACRQGLFKVRLRFGVPFHRLEVGGQPITARDGLLVLLARQFAPQTERLLVRFLSFGKSGLFVQAVA